MTTGEREAASDVHQVNVRRSGCRLRTGEREDSCAAEAAGLHLIHTLTVTHTHKTLFLLHASSLQLLLMFEGTFSRRIVCRSPLVDWHIVLSAFHRQTHEVLTLDPLSRSLAAGACRVPVIRRSAASLSLAAGVTSGGQ